VFWRDWRIDEGARLKEGIRHGDLTKATGAVGLFSLMFDHASTGVPSASWAEIFINGDLLCEKDVSSESLPVFDVAEKIRKFGIPLMTFAGEGDGEKVFDLQTWSSWQESRRLFSFTSESRKNLRTMIPLLQGAFFDTPSERTL
jgi:hypothetical protein